MKYYLPLFLILMSLTSIKAQEEKNEITTYYLIRHAEKDRTDNSNKDPNLTEIGQNRAKNWSIVFESIPFDIIYSTNYNRTIQTAEPTANSKNLEIKYYNPRELYDEKFKFKTTGKTVLVVGHSNTTPQFVNKIIGEEKYADIDDLNNSNLYIVTIINGVKTAILLKIEY
ncbi:histidine phosphatase family protein [Lutibacter sp.]|uniref:SixA phosphatase family protein n=1 Tax=Lutibacter sp. TaxID=1925666 RepID=UPI0025C423C2|nr:histidine phosphatase family protein [Lutibacter sp.]MCF6167042.1 histidine phosphatase family protein [Lutibacter sp.]